MIGVFFLARIENKRSFSISLKTGDFLDGAIRYRLASSGGANSSSRTESVQKLCRNNYKVQISSKENYYYITITNRQTIDYQ